MRVLTLPLLIACVASACTVSTSGSPTAAPDAPSTSSTSRATATPGADAIHYDCDDGRGVRIGYGDHNAILQMDDEPAIILPRAESASTTGVDVYVGRHVALQREGDSIQLELTGASLRCWPTPPSP